MACLAVFDRNLPEYFHEQEREEFAAFLDAPAGAYFVVEHEGAVVGCAGYVLEDAELASLTWLMVRRDLQRSGLGKFLAFSAMRRLSRDADPAMLRLHTTPAVSGFFEKLGFRVVERIADGIAPGLDRVEMRKKLKVCG